MATHCHPRTRSCRTSHAISNVQNGIVNTSTAVRPTPPPASAIVVEPKLIVVWKKPAMAAARQSCGNRGCPRRASTPNSTTIAIQVRWILTTTGCAWASASFITIQLLPQISVSTMSAA